MQTKKNSFIESCTNTFIGLVIAYIMMQYVLAPLLNIPIAHSQNMIITAVLTVCSVLRGYVLRRVFNKIRGGK